MPTYILMHKHSGVALYHEYGTVVDAPVSAAMTREEFEVYYRERNGENGMDGLPARLARADAHGSSSRLAPTSFNEEIRCNRAGPDEAELGPVAYRALVVEMRAEQGLPSLDAPRCA